MMLRFFPIVLLLVVLLGATAVTSNAYYLQIVANTAIWAMYGIAWNIFSGFGGLISFGHAIFFGIGSYIVVLLSNIYGISPIFGLPIAAAIASVAALVIGLVTFRLRSYYFALAMLSFPLCAMYLVGWAGFQEVPFSMVHQNAGWHLQFQNARIVPIICICLAAAAALVSVRVETSRFGLALSATRQNEAAALASGVSAFRTRLLALVLSAGLSAMAGGLYALVVLVVTPESAFGLHVSAQPLIVSMFGGTTATGGPILGALILIPLTEILHAQLGEILPGVQGVMLGIALILVVSFLPHGIYPSLERPLQRWFGRLTRAAPPRSTQSDPLEKDQAYRPLIAAQDGAEVLSVRELSVSFGGVKACHDVSFSVTEGEIVGIIGPNGAGKTTLFNAITGFVGATGKVTLNGKDIAGFSPNRIAKMGLGRTFQTARPFPELTMLDNVTVGAMFSSETLAQARETAASFMRLVELSPADQRRADELKNDELRLAELARAIAARPNVLLLDEPFAGLSMAEIDRMLRAIQALRGCGLSVVIIDHNVSYMRRLVDRLVVLDHGVIVVQGGVDAVLSDSAVIRAYLGQETADGGEGAAMGSERVHGS